MESEKAELSGLTVMLQKSIEVRDNFIDNTDVAPFDGDGKVFIYRGSDAGIETKPAQVSFSFFFF